MTSTGSDFPDPGDLPGTGGPGVAGRWRFGLEVGEVERPHVVVTLDTRTGGATFSGPYRTALGALCAADVEYQVDRDQGGRGELTFHVAALRAPIDSDDTDPVLDGDDGLPRGHHARPLGRALAVLATVAERAIGRRPRLTMGVAAVTAAACASGLSEGRTRRGRTPRQRHLPGRDAR